MTVEAIAAALVGVRIGGIPLSKQEAERLARIIVERVPCKCSHP